jgi:REP element-mobilizing transposase RayT
MSQDHNHLNHATWECKYHVVFTPKYRKKVLFGHRSGGTWALYFTSLPGARNARSKTDT